jgi:branched-chain amino acid transport system permease protein
MMRWLWIALWTGLLALPLTGPADALRIAAVLLVCGWLWQGGVAALRRPVIVRTFERFSESLRAVRLAPPVLRQPRLVLAALLPALLILPLFLNNYYRDILVLTGIYVVLALGLNIVVGLAGLLDLGYAAFYAIGAYTYALLSVHFGLPFWLGLPLGGLMAGLFGVILGTITLRLRGDYLAIVTLGFIQIVRLVLNNWDSVTNGPNGILGIGRPAIGGFVFRDPIHFYYLIVSLAALAVFVAHRLNHSRIGRAWIAIREDEIAAMSMGINATRMKVSAFAIGAAWAGIAGVFFAGRFGFISPESFTFLESVTVLAMVVLGGMGSTPGVILGAAVIVILPELLRGVSEYRMLIFGGALVAMMVFRPQGLIFGARRKIELTETSP